MTLIIWKFGFKELSLCFIDLKFIGFWLFYKSCFWLAKPLVLGYFKVRQFNEKIGRQLSELDDSLRTIQKGEKEDPVKEAAEPVESPIAETVVEGIQHDNEVQNAYQNMSGFFKMLDQEREQLKAQRQEAEAKKLEIVQKYIRQTLLHLCQRLRNLGSTLSMLGLSTQNRQPLKRPSAPQGKPNVYPSWRTLRPRWQSSHCEYCSLAVSAVLQNILQKQ